MRTRIRLALGALGAHRPAAIALLLLSAVLAALAVALGTFTSAYLTTVRQGAESTVGAAYQSSGGSAEATQALRAAATSHPSEWIGVRSGFGQIQGRASDDVSAGYIRLQSAPADYGTLVAGSPARGTGDVVVTQRMAEAARLSIGDRVRVTTDEGSAAGVITGITRNNADIADSTAAVIGDPSQVLASCDTWLSRTSPEGLSSATRRDSQAGVLSITTREHIADRAVADARSRALGALRPLQMLFLIVSAAVLCASLLAVLSRLQPVIDAARAAGMTALRAERWTGSGFIGVIILGAVLGVLGVQLAIGPLAPAISARLDQHWTSAAIDPMTLLQVLAGIALALGAAALIRLRSMRPRTRAAFPPPRSVRLPLVIGGAGVVLAGLLLWSRWQQILLYGNLLGMVLGSVCLPMLMLALPLLVRTRLQASASRPPAGMLTAPLILTTMTVCFASFFSAGMISSTAWAGLGPRDSGFFDVQGLSLSDVRALRTAHPDVMSHAIILTLARDSPVMSRATAPSDAPCFEEAIGKTTSESCEAEVLTFIAFAPEAGPGRDLADHGQPEIIGPSGDVPLVEFTPATDAVRDVTAIGGISADPSIGGNLLPGLILRPGSAAAAHAGLAPSDTAQVHIPDFRGFSDQERDSFRRDVLTRAGYAMIMEPDSSEDLQIRTTAFTYAALAALLAAAASALLALSLMSFQAPLRQSLDILGASRWQRARLALPLAVAIGVCITGAAVAGMAAAAPSFASIVDGVGYSPGWFWALPVGAALLMPPAILLAASRTGAQHRAQRRDD